MNPSSMEIDDEVPPTAGPAVTSGLFKSKKKRGASTATAAAAAAAPAASSASASAAASSAPASSSSARPRASSSMLSFDESAESLAEAAAGGVDLSAARLREEREARKRAKRTRAAEDALKEPPTRGANNVAAPAAAAAASASSASLYTPEALAALRKNAVHVSSSSSSSHGLAPLDREDAEDEVNLAALRPSGGASSTALHAPLPSGSFRPSGRSKQIALQEADDFKRTSAVRKLAPDDTARDRELQKLTEERLVRAAKLQRDRARRLGADSNDMDAMSGEKDYIPLGAAFSSTGTLAVRAGTGSALVRATQLDQQYLDAIDDESGEPQSRLLRDDADDRVVNEYDDSDPGRAQGAVGGDRVRFGDPAGAKGKGKGNKGLDHAVGALLSSSAQAHAKKTRGDSIRNALRIDQDDEEDGADAEELEGGAEEDEDDETRLWEEEMMRKGGASAGVARAAAAAPKAKGVLRASALANTSTDDGLTLAQQVDQSLAQASSASGQVVGAIEPVDLLAFGLERQLETMQLAHGKLNERYRRVEQAIKAEEKMQSSLSGQIDAKNDSYVFFQHLTDRLLTALDCLSEKSRDIDAARAELDAMRATRRSEIDARIAEHERDLWTEAGFGPKEAARPSAAPQVDEFGRDIGSAQDREQVQRGETRRAWFAAQVAKQVEAQAAQKKLDAMPIKIQFSAAAGSTAPTSAAANPLGWESLHGLVTSDSELGCSRFDSAVNSLVADTAHIFSDTAPAFRSMDGIKRWMEDWKRKERESYLEAYIPTSMPIILAPYVKLELMQRWNVLAQPHLDDHVAPPLLAGEEGPAQSWYKRLFDYGQDSAAPAAGAAEDEDAHLLPTLIDKILLPLVIQWTRLQFEPTLPSHVAALRSCVEDIEVHLPDPAASVTMQSLRAAIMQRYEALIQAHQQSLDNVPSSDPGAALTGSVGNQAAFCLYRFYSALALFASLTSFASVLDEQQLKVLASRHMIQSLLPFLAWKVAQVDCVLTNPSLTRPPPERSPAAPSSLVDALRTLPLTPYEELLAMTQRLLTVFPRAWIQRAPGAAASSSTSMTQLHELLSQLQQQAKDTRAAQATIKQLRTLLKK